MSKPWIGGGATKSRPSAAQSGAVRISSGQGAFPQRTIAQQPSNSTTMGKAVSKIKSERKK